MFEPNEDAEVKVIENIKGRSAIIVDDFYRNKLVSNGIGDLIFCRAYLK